jgi:hypothetical protein
MSQTAVAKALFNELSRHRWLVSVGVGAAGRDGRPMLIIYTTSVSEAKKAIPREWKGFPVVVRRMGRVRPAVAQA